MPGPKLLNERAAIAETVAGFLQHVRPLLGGLHAGVSAGHPKEGLRFGLQARELCVHLSLDPLLMGIAVVRLARRHADLRLVAGRACGARFSASELSTTARAAAAA
jgi:hypothetical protein